MRRRLTILALATALAAAAFAAAVAAGRAGEASPAGPSGAGLAGGLEGPKGNFTLGEARAFAGFPLLYAGESFRGLPLTAVLRRHDRPYPGEPIQPNTVAFVYGDCEASDDTGCAPPLEVKIWPACRRNPSVYDLADDADEQLTVRGAPASFYDGWTRLEISTGRVTAVLYGSARGQLLEAAQSLRGANVAQAAGVDLPPPARGAVGGELACAPAE